MAEVLLGCLWDILGSVVWCCGEQKIAIRAKLRFRCFRVRVRASGQEHAAIGPEIPYQSNPDID